MVFTVTGYRADYTGASTSRPMQVRPRSSHRDNVTDKQFHATTENGKSYRRVFEIKVLSLN